MQRRRVFAGLLSAILAMGSVMLVPMAWADQGRAVVPVTESPANPPGDSEALAHTALNIAVPTVIGLAILLLGTALVAWAVLRGSRSRRSRT